MSESVNAGGTVGAVLKETFGWIAVGLVSVTFIDFATAFVEIGSWAQAILAFYQTYVVGGFDALFRGFLNWRVSSYDELLTLWTVAWLGLTISSIRFGSTTYPDRGAATIFLFGYMIAVFLTAVALQMLMKNFQFFVDSDCIRTATTGMNFSETWSYVFSEASDEACNIYRESGTGDLTALGFWMGLLGFLGVPILAITMFFQRRFNINKLFLRNIYAGVIAFAVIFGSGFVA